ncbi:MAG TPA: hypothetical protein VD948_05705, partial [Rhodothermales bacterium]|nr:hypothetical protein [Rhodothermales bacterium]
MPDETPAPTVEPTPPTGELFRIALLQFEAARASESPAPVAAPSGPSPGTMTAPPGMDTDAPASSSLAATLAGSLRQRAKRHATVAGLALLACLVPAAVLAQSPSQMTDASGRPLLPHEQVEQMLREKTGRVPSPALVRGVSNAMQELHAMPGSPGALDTSFDTDGKQTISFVGSSSSYGRSIAIDASGRVVVAGYTYMGASGNDFAVARLTSAGALDTSFDTDGKQTISFVGSSHDIAIGVAVEGSGRVVVAGYTYNGGYDFAVARLTSAGALDTSFDTDGIQTIAFGSSDDIGSTVALDGSGRVVVAGYAYNGSNHDFAVARLTSAGALDTSFDTDGKQTIAFGSGHDVGSTVALDGSGRIVVAGYAGMGSTGNDFAVARLTSAGALDTSFDTDG